MPPAVLRRPSLARSLAVPLGLAALLVVPEAAAQRLASNRSAARRAPASPAPVDTMRAYRSVPIPLRVPDAFAADLSARFAVLPIALGEPGSPLLTDAAERDVAGPPAAEVSVEAQPEAAEAQSEATALPAPSDASPPVSAEPLPSLADSPPGATTLAAAAPPVRVALTSSARRRVVLVPGVSQLEPPPAPVSAPDPEPGARVVISQVTVLVGEGGRRTLVYSAPTSRPYVDLGRGAACGAGALQAGARLRGLRTSSLREGMRGDAVRAAQQLLCAAGYASPQSGVYDAETARAVEAFQAAYNAAALAEEPLLRVDGVFGTSTRRAVEASLQRSR